MKMRKAAAFLLALLLTAALALPVSAEAAGERFTIPDTNFSFEVPEGAVFIHGDLPNDDPAWSALNILDAGEKRTEFYESGLTGEIHLLDSGRVISVSEKRSENFSEYVFNLYDLDEETKQTVFERLSPSNETEGTGGTIQWVDHPQNPFFCIDLYSNLPSITNGEEEETVYERLYGTIVNGGLISFDLYPTSEPVSDELDAVLRQLVASSEVSEFLPRPTYEITPQAILSLVVLGLIILLIIGFFVRRSVMKRREKREKAEMSNQLVAYRKKKEGREEEGDGELRFVNETDHSDAAVRAYANYQAYRHGLFLPGFTILVAVGGLAFILRTGIEENWWMVLVLLACISYCGYRIGTAASTLTKTLTRVYGKFRSRKATYYFYDGDFRITGMQASNLHPYFQITRLAEHGEYFYLYFGEDNAYYIHKDNFTEGSVEEFKAFIKEKLGDKAKVK